MREGDQYLGIEDCSKNVDEVLRSKSLPSYSQRKSFKILNFFFPIQNITFIYTKKNSHKTRCLRYNQIIFFNFFKTYIYKIKILNYLFFFLRIQYKITTIEQKKKKIFIILMFNFSLKLNIETLKKKFFFGRKFNSVTLKREKAKKRFIEKNKLKKKSTRSIHFFF